MQKVSLTNKVFTENPLLDEIVYNARQIATGVIVKDWDKRYFTKLAYWMQENFAKSRLPYIRKVGKVVHRDTVEKYNKSREEFEEYKKKMIEKKLAEKRKIFKKKK